MKPNVFVGSSKENLSVARALKRNLQSAAIVKVWDKDIFDLSKSSLESLLAKLPSFDFGVFVLGRDDLATIRKRRVAVPRDNVVFELGLFFGHLGRDRTFLLVPRGATKIHLPTDLLGITYANYDPATRASTLRAGLSDACNQLRAAMAIGVDQYSHYLAAHPRVVSRLLLSPTIARSPFVYDNLLRDAKTEVFIAAQNHHHIAVKEAKTSKQSLFDFLKVPGRKARILACDPSDCKAIATWSYVTNDLYKSHLEKAISTLSKWVRAAKRSGLDLKASVVPFVPVISVTFVDPRDVEFARLVFTPNFYQVVAGTRPCYFLNCKEHREVFDTYWKNYEYAFDNGRPLG